MQDDFVMYWGLWNCAMFVFYLITMILLGFALYQHRNELPTLTPALKWQAQILVSLLGVYIICYLVITFVENVFGQETIPSICWKLYGWFYTIINIFFAAWLWQFAFVRREKMASEPIGKLGRGFAWFVIIGIVLVLASILCLVACDKDDEDLVDESGKSVIRIFMNGGNEYDGRKKDSVWLKIEEEANVSLRIEGATHNSDYYQTLNPMINTGDIPDVIFTVPSSSGKAYSNWVEQELLWNIDELLDTCREYTKVTSRRISFEYAMISGVNDSDECARELGKKLKGMLCHVNLIPVNSVKERDYKKSSDSRIAEFIKILEKYGINVTVRRTLGSDINASCGQLRRGDGPK